MTLIKYMSIATTFSVFTALISIVWQALLALKQLNKVTAILTGLLAIESGLKRPLDAPRARLKVAIGYGACTDLMVNAVDFLEFPNNFQQVDTDLSADDINDEDELLQTFSYYFQNGAAAERFMPNAQVFRKLITTAKTEHRDKVKWFIGGNAPLMGNRFHIDGADVLLGAHMSKKLRRLLPADIKVAGDEIEEDDIHIILEYKAGDSWGHFVAPRANRFILHNDQNNPHLTSIEAFGAALGSFQPRLLVISGLQTMDSYKFEEGVRESRLLKVHEQISSQSPYTLQHFEMASYVDLDLLQLLRHYILPHMDSIGLNEQELENLSNVLAYNRTTLATNCNPRIATTLDHMRKVFTLLSQDYYARTGNATVASGRLISRIHLHTLAFQALLITKDSQWQNPRAAAAKAALTAHRYVCQNEMINPESASLVLDDSFAVSADTTAKRIEINQQNPVPCWDEYISITGVKSIEVEICVAPVLVCRVAKKTAGAGDNISAAGLSQQL